MMNFIFSITLLCFPYGMSGQIVCQDLKMNDSLSFEGIESAAAADSSCYQIFYTNQESMLNIRNAHISLYEEMKLIPCCMRLVLDGDTIARAILYERMSERITRILNGDKKYQSIFKIADITLAELHDIEFLGLTMKLFQIDRNAYYEDGCTHIGYFIYNSILLKQIDPELSGNYYAQSIMMSRQAHADGLIGCMAEEYVYDRIYPIVLNDYLQNKITFSPGK